MFVELMLKAIYSLILVSVVVFIGLELKRIWWDANVYVGRFVKISDDKADKVVDETFGKRVVFWHSELRHYFATGASLQFAAEAGLTPDVSTPIENSETVLSELEITVSEVNITQILERLRKWISAPREIKGHLVESNGIYRATVDVNDTIETLADGRKVARSFQIMGVPSEEELAFEIACALVWRQAAAAQVDKIGNIPQRKFCNWVSAWVKYRQYLDKSARLDGLSETDLNDLKALLKSVTRALEGEVPYIRFLSLRANIAKLLLEYEKDSDTRVKLTADMQSDRFRYMVRLNVDPAAQANRSGARDAKILAGMRPAIPIKGGKLDYAPLKNLDLDLKTTKFAETWENILKDAAGTLSGADKATGTFQIKRKSSGAVTNELLGVAVGENLVLALGFGVIGSNPDLTPKGHGTAIELPDDAWEAKFRFTSALAAKSGTKAILAEHRIRRIVRLGGTGVNEALLLEIEGHDIEKNRPLSLEPDAIDLSRDDHFVAVVGYPTDGANLPNELAKALLGGKPGIKRVMPGRIRAISGSGPNSAIYGNLISFEAMTFGGTGGGPLMDLHTGKLIGFHFGGRFENDESAIKIGWAVPTAASLGPKQVMDLFEETSGSELTFEKIANAVEEAHKNDEAVSDANELPRRGPHPPSDNFASAIDSLEAVNALGYNASFLPGNPINLPQADKKLEKFNYGHFTAALDPVRRLPAYAAANFDGSQSRKVNRVSFARDVRVPEELRAGLALYKASPFDRGQLIQRRYVTWGSVAEATAANLTAMSDSVITPQYRMLNLRSWRQLEEFIFNWLVENGHRATIFAGPVFAENDPIYRNEFKIPQAFWKIMVTTDPSGGELRAVAYLLKQDLTIDDEEIRAVVPSFDPLASRIEISELEHLTGLRFDGLIGLRSPF